LANRGDGRPAESYDAAEEDERAADVEWSGDVGDEVGNDTTEDGGRVYDGKKVEA